MRGSASTILVPCLAAFFIHVAATGWFDVGLDPITTINSACSTSLTGLLTAPEPTPSNNAATLDAWHSRVQWSTLLLPKPVRTSFWNKYASSLLPLALPKPANDFLPCVSRKFTNVLVVSASASSQLASLNVLRQSVACVSDGMALGAPAMRIKGLVNRSVLCA